MTKKILELDQIFKRTTLNQKLTLLEDIFPKKSSYFLSDQKKEGECDNKVSSSLIKKLELY